jgi:GT2 family glycosyltransferase
MTEKRASVAIVIPVYNRRETTLQGLRSLSQIDLTGIDLHTVIIDDGSPDGTGDAIRSQFPEVEVITGEGTLHYAAGTNRGISAALERGVDYIVTANDDALFHPAFLQRMLETARVNTRAVVGAMLLLWDRPHKPFQVGFKWRTFAGGWTEPDTVSAFDLPRDAFEVEGLAGNCVLIPIDAVRECGLMDEARFPHGWGDIQYFVRMRKAGWRLLVEPRAYVWCEPNTNPRPLHQLSLSDKMTILFKNRRHPMNFQRQFIARWESAPNKLAAGVAFMMYLISLVPKVLGKSSGRVVEVHPR